MKGNKLPVLSNPHFNEDATTLFYFQLYTLHVKSVERA